MTVHDVGTREEWRKARLELLDAEKAQTRRGDELAEWRRQLPWVRIDKDYAFDADEGPRPLPICSGDGRSSSSITSCSDPTTRQGAPRARR